MKDYLEIDFQNMDKSPALETLIQEKADGLEKYNKDIISCLVSVAKPHAHQSSGSGYSVRIEVRIPPNQQLVATEHSSHGQIHDPPEKVVRKAFDAMQRQVRDLKEIIQDSHHEQPDENQPGLVVVLDKEKRFGIIKTVAGRDIFFSEGAVLNDDFERLEVGTSVRYEDEPGEEGPRATTVQIVDKRGGSIASPSPNA